MSGRAYSHPGYAASLSEFGRPRELSRSGGWVLERQIPRTDDNDLMGPYPLFTCDDWSGLPADLDELGDAFVSVVVVVDPLADVDEAALSQAFPDLRAEMKPHFVRNLERPGQLPSHHRRHVRRASSASKTEICRDPVEHLDDWTRLYAELAERHRITGIRAFSRTAFRQQLELPGMVAARAETDGMTVGMALFLEDAPHAYYHLAAYSSEGYDISASYALFALAFEHLAERGVTRVDLGGGAGTNPNGNGLVRFKRGWANEERVARLCGRILNRPRYDELSGDKRSGTDWFPAYRASDRDLAPETR
jgi:hypothetical protein